jgi:hypothetical protein
MVARDTHKEDKLFHLLLIGFVAQIAGRLVDLQWHLAHDEFEGAAEQLRAHWLIWFSTIFILGVAIAAVRSVGEPGQHRGYLIVLAANLAYGVIAVIHLLSAPRSPRSRLGPSTPCDNEHRGRNRRPVGDLGAGGIAAAS